MPAHLIAELVPEKLGGLPAHPLLVHVPVVMVPLAAVGALLALVRPPWRSWALPLVAVLSTAAVVGIQLAMDSGEGLEEASGEHNSLIERHSQLAEQTRPIAVLFAIAAIAVAVLHWRRSRADAAPADGETASVSSAARWARFLTPLCALSVLLGGISTVWVVRTGHAGARSVWKEEGDSGGDKAKPDGDRDRGSDSGTSPTGDGDTDGD